MKVIAISALVGMTVTLAGSAALAQPAPVETPPPPPGAQQAAQQAAPAPESPPPPPPAPGAAPPAVEPPPAVPSPFPEGESPDERMDLAGWNGGFFIRDSRDMFRFYPHFLAEADFYSSAGGGVTGGKSGEEGVRAADVAAGLKPRLFIRRARIGFEAELLKRWSAGAILEFGGQQVGNLAGNQEQLAAPPGQTPTATTGRYAPVESVATTPVPADVYINYSVCRCFNIQIGHFNIPFSMDNRTGDLYYPEIEHSAAIRSFVIGNNPRDLGAILWGELGPRVFVYELGVFGGDGQNRPSVDARVDVIGRMFVRPFAGGGTSDIEKFTQIGVSARYGERDPASVGYDYSAITTAQGYVLWRPTYNDSAGRLVHVIPSGAQRAIGGELRLQVGRFALQGEAYFVANNTREAVDGYQLTNTERLGRMLGVGWYGQVNVWPLGDKFVWGEPGIYRPRRLDFSAKSPAKTPHGLELVGLVSGINASYKGATRLDSTPDANTPMGNITIYQFNAQANYWHSRHARLGFAYSAYLAPDSGDPTKNQAVVPDNLVKRDGTTGTGHVFHEMTARIAVGF